jgi:hypothetical protein
VNANDDVNDYVSASDDANNHISNYVNANDDASDG